MSFFRGYYELPLFASFQNPSKSFVKGFLNSLALYYLKLVNVDKWQIFSPHPLFFTFALRIRTKTATEPLFKSFTSSRIAGDKFERTERERDITIPHSLGCLYRFSKVIHEKTYTRKGTARRAPTKTLETLH